MKTKIAKKKQAASSAGQPGIGALLKIAASLRIQSRKAENVACWREKTFNYYVESEPVALTPKQDAALLKAAQAQRDAGVLDADLALFIIYGIAERLAEDAVYADLELKKLSGKMRAVERREGGPDGGWLLNDPDAPKDWKALNSQWVRRHEELIAAVLKRCGEDELADLVLNDQDELSRRSHAGHRLVFKDDPEKLAKVDELYLTIAKNRSSQPCQL